MSIFGKNKFDDLIDACQKGDVAKVEKILAQDKNLTRATDKNGLTALMCASSHGQMCVVELLLKAGADPNKKFNRLSPLNAAEVHGHRDVVELLIKSGADRK
jgi:ankyrin repeat protein